MKRRVRPVANAPHQPVLHGIDVTILDMTCIVGVITNQMFPESALPNAALVARRANGGSPLVLWQGFGKPRIHQSPSRRKINIARGQFPDSMQMVRQNYDR